LNAFITHARARIKHPGIRLLPLAAGDVWRKKFAINKLHISSQSLKVTDCK
jgi:hypothetical protein